MFRLLCACALAVLMAQFPAPCAAQAAARTTQVANAPATGAAAPAGHSAVPGSLAEALRAFAEREALAQLAYAGPAAAQARVEVSGGQIDPRLQLAACARTEAFAPNGMRYWGRAAVGLRCVQGASWSVLAPVLVRIHGPALVPTRALAAGSTVTPDDVRIAEAEWTRESQGVVADVAQLDHRVLARSLPAGLPIPLAALRTPQAVGQGDMVKVVGTGTGFSIATSGVALASAVDGQPVRVRTENGRVLTGTARSGRIVEVLF